MFQIHLAFLTFVCLSVLENASLKSYLKSLLLNIEEDLNVTQKRLDCLKLHV